MSGCIEETDYFYGSVYDNDGGEYSWNYRKSWIGGYAKLHPGYDEKIQETYSTRTSAIQAIENTIQKGNIDFITLAGSMLFLEESYIISRPDDCLYCNDPEELELDRIAKYYETHIKKCLWKPDRINEFKDKQIDLIERIINKFNDYKKQVIREIIKKAKNQGISKDELKNNRPNWKNTLRSLTNKEKIAEYQTKQLEEDIKKLVEAKNKSAEERQQAEAEVKENARKEEERLKKEREEQERKVKEETEKREQKEAEEREKQEQEAKKQAAEQAKQQELNQKKEEFISRITAALNQEEYPLTNSNLSPQYQNWEIQISQINELQLITNLQDRLLADIQARRQDKKSAQKVRENLDKVQTGTEEEKKQAWENLEKNETEKGYQDNKEEVEKLKKAKATENPQEYSEEAKKRITKKLEDNKVKEEELSDENQKHWQKLKGGEIIDSLQLVNIETKIKENIYQKEAKKKINNLTSRVGEILNSKSNNKKFQIETLKKELLQFISDGNVYYSAQKTLAESLLAKLENYLITTDDNQNIPAKSPFFPWKIIIPFLLVGLLITAILLIRKRKIKK